MFDNIYIPSVEEKIICKLLRKDEICDINRYESEK